MDSSTAAGAAQPYQPGLFEAERYIRTPQAHAAQLHQDGLGIAVIARKSKSGGWSERRYPTERAITQAAREAGRGNVYLSMQRFRRSRSLAQLLALGSMYVDIDYYTRTQYQGMHAYMVLELVMEHLDGQGIPRPTLAIASGRGLYVVWQHEAIPRQALPRWQAAQDTLIETLKEFGADGQSRDAARVLRMVGTRHGAATVESLLPVGEVYGFDGLADMVLPHSRAEIHDLRIQRALREGERDARTPRERPRKAPEGFGVRTLHEARLSDLQALWSYRRAEGAPLDYRHRWMYHAAGSMAWLATDAEVYRREVEALALEVCGWSERKARTDMGSVIRRAERAYRGETMEYEGEEVDPRYRARNSTIIEALDITPEEQRRMRTIIGATEKKRRDDERRGTELTRSEYEGRAHQRRQEARRMAAEGTTRAQIAERLGVTKRHVQRMLQGGDMCAVVLGIYPDPERVFLKAPPGPVFDFGPEHETPAPQNASPRPGARVRGRRPG